MKGKVFIIDLGEKQVKYSQYRERTESVKQKIPFQPLIGVVLGTGLNNFAEKLSNSVSVSFSEIPNRPHATNKSHKGRFVFGFYDNIPVVVSEGRLHYYEGYTSEECVRPIRLRKRLGIKRLVLTNACGSANPEFKPGSFLFLKDQISRMVPSPLIGENIPEFGPRFPDRSDVYDRKDREVILQEGRKESLPIHEGTYRQFTGPQYETAAEVSLAHNLGADAVGRSTAIEAIASSHRGLKTIGISLLTNYGTGISSHKLTDEEVVERGKENSKNFEKLLEIALKVLWKGMEDD